MCAVRSILMRDGSSPYGGDARAAPGGLATKARRPSFGNVVIGLVIAVLIIFSAYRFGREDSEGLAVFPESHGLFS